MAEEELIDQYIRRRNEIQLKAEQEGETEGRIMWSRLGVANRHIERVLGGALVLTPAVEAEINRCFEFAQKSL